jgi:hypothetical protein
MRRGVLGDHDLVRRDLFIQYAAAVATFAIVAPLAEARLGWDIRSLVVDFGEAAGMGVSYIGNLVIGPNGPFLGRGPAVDAWNFLWWISGWALPLLMGWAAAVGVFLTVGRLLSRRPGDGYTRCGRCGYILEGLKEPRCPECGHRI